MKFSNIQEAFDAYERAVRSRYEAREADQKEDAKHYKKQATLLEKRIYDL